MRVFLIIVFFVTVAGGCSKSPSGPSSAEGKWTYTTADSKIKVTFDLVKTASGSLDIQNPAMTVDGTLANASAVITGVSLPDIVSMRINANDMKVTYPYYIFFSACKVSSDFKHIDVAAGEYSFPFGTTISFKNISIVRP